MTILIELEQFRKPGLGKSRFNSALERARSKNIPLHPIHSWVRSAGISKPTLVYDLNIIKDRMRWLAELSSSFSALPLVAVKSCTDASFLELAHQNLNGFDVSNFAEYSVLPSDLQGKLVSVTSPALPADLDIFSGKGNDLIVSLDSQAQLDRHLSLEHPCEYLLRIQGSSLLEEAGTSDPAYYPVTRFGFSVDEVIKLLQAPRMKNALPVGFHVHHGSEANQLSTYRTLINGLSKLSDLLDRPLKYINLGGGWHCLTPQDFSSILGGARKHFPEPCSILLEPGRWYAQTAGYAIGTIVNLSQAGEVVRCTLDLSAKSHIRWSNPRMLHLFEPHQERGCVVQFFGPSCYESDLIGKYYLPYSTDVIKEANLEYGNQVIFGNVSTYSREWNVSFNGVPMAEIEWVRL